VTHIFHGETQEEARAFERAHQKADTFYAAAVEGRPFSGIRLMARKSWIC
jgi:hypothetical protein